MSAPRTGGPAATDAPDRRESDDQRWRLEDQRDFLSRSLADLQAELAAGDIAPSDFEALRARDQGRLSAIEAELQALDEAEAVARATPNTEEATVAPARGVRRRRLWLAIVAVVALTAGTTLLVVHLATPSLPGQPITGSTTQSVAALLDEAQLLVNEGTRTSLGQALNLYREVLAEAPNQPQALAETGWLEWEAGFTARLATLENHGRELVQRSLKVEPDDYGAHLYLGTIDLEQDHDATAAVGQFRLFLAEHPPKSQITAAAAIVTQAFTAAGQPLPSAVPSG